MTDKAKPKAINYHQPGLKISCRDGTEYLVGRNGAWRKIKEKDRWKDKMRELKAETDKLKSNINKAE